MQSGDSKQLGFFSTGVWPQGQSQREQIPSAHWNSQNKSQAVSVKVLTCVIYGFTGYPFTYHQPPIDRLFLSRTNFYSQESPFISSEEFARSQGRRNTAGKTAGRYRLADCWQKFDPHVAHGQQCARLFRISSPNYIDLFRYLNWSMGLAHVYQYGLCKGVPYLCFMHLEMLLNMPCVMRMMHKDALNCKSAVPSRHSWRSLEIGYGS